MATDVETLRKADAPQRSEPPSPYRGPFLLQLYRSALGKKYVMAITGVIGIGFVVAHLVGNFKLFLGPEATDFYGEWLRESLGYPILPHTWTLWLLRLVLIVSLVLHVQAAYSLTVMNRRARPTRYASQRHYVAADFAGRTMRLTGIVVLAFLIYHLADFTWGVEALPGEFERGAVYANTVSSFSVPIVSAFYIVSMLALGTHLYHGTWSLFQSLGMNSPTFKKVRYPLAVALSAGLTVGFIIFPVAVLVGVIE